MAKNKIQQKISNLPDWGKEIISRFILYFSVLLAIFIFTSTGILYIREQLKYYHPSNVLIK